MRRAILNPTFAVVVCTGILLAVIAAMKWGLHQAEITLGLPLFLVFGVIAMAAILLIAAAVDRRERRSRGDRPR